MCMLNDGIDCGGSEFAVPDDCLLSNLWQGALTTVAVSLSTRTSSAGAVAGVVAFVTFRFVEVDHRYDRSTSSWKAYAKLALPTCGNGSKHGSVSMAQQRSQVVRLEPCRCGSKAAG